MNRYYDIKELELLFNELRIASLDDKVNGLEAAIWQVWMDARSETINKKMLEGTEYMAEQEYCQAIMVFTEMTERWETYSEVWNKRATAYYLKGEFKNSLADIVTTLSIEPRHFGALSGRAAIYRELYYDKGVIKSLIEMQELMPGKSSLAKQIDEVRSRL